MFPKQKMITLQVKFIDNLLWAQLIMIFKSNSKTNEITAIYKNFAVCRNMKTVCNPPKEQIISRNNI